MQGSFGNQIFHVAARDEIYFHYLPIRLPILSTLFLLDGLGLIHFRKLKRIFAITHTLWLQCLLGTKRSTGNH